MAKIKIYRLPNKIINRLKNKFLIKIAITFIEPSKIHKIRKTKKINS